MRKLMKKLEISDDESIQMWDSDVKPPKYDVVTFESFDDGRTWIEINREKAELF